MFVYFAKTEVLT